MLPDGVRIPEEKLFPLRVSIWYSESCKIRRDRKEVLQQVCKWCKGTVEQAQAGLKRETSRSLVPVLVRLYAPPSSSA